MSQLDQIREMTVVVADTGDIEAIRKHQPQDATTNPSLIFKAAQMDEYRGLVDDAVGFARSAGGDEASRIRACIDRLAVEFGKEILGVVPGRVSTEVDARLSFDTEGSVEKAHALIKMYETDGIDRKRVLIKVAATWEGIRAAEQLEREGIHCNLTLLFSFAQAVACAEAGVTLISPFVGRIFDWHKRARGVDAIPAAEDPGVLSVARIYTYFKKFGYKTEVMGASFRNTGQIIELAGCDLLTISPGLLEQLDTTDGPIERKLEPERARSQSVERVELNEKAYRWMHNEDAMAVEKLAEGIRLFTADLIRLEQYVGGFVHEAAGA